MNYTKTEWKDLPDTSTPITSSRLNNMEDGIEYLFEHGVGGGDNLPVGVEMDFDGTSQDIPTGWTQVTNPESYSTTEVKTDRVWIDNKPIYKKVISIGNLPNNDAKSVSIGYLSTEITVVKLEGIAIYSNGITLPMPNVSSVGLEQVKLTINGNGEVVVQTYNDRTSAIGYVTLEYTKVSDQGGNS